MQVFSARSSFFKCHGWHAGLAKHFANPAADEAIEAERASSDDLLGNNY